MKRDNLSDGVTLERYYIWNPDELGDLSYWRFFFHQLKEKFPWPEIFQGYRFEVWHRDHPHLPAKILDFDPVKPGEQKTMGLTNQSRSMVAVYPDSYWEDGRDYRPLNPRPVGRWLYISKRTGFHEFGHWYARKANFWGSKPIQVLTRAAFDKYYDIDDYYSNKTDPSERLAERFAESLIPLFYSPGLDRDGQPVSVKPEAETVVRLLYWLNTRLANKNVKHFNVYPEHVTWLEESGWLWWKSFTWWKLDREYRLFKGVDGGWKEK